MKLRNRTIWALALCTATGITVAQADKPPQPGTPAVQLPQDSERVQVSTPLGGPAVTLPARPGISTGSGPDMAGTTTPTRVAAIAPKVTLPSGTQTWVVPGPENGPVVSRP